MDSDFLVKWLGERLDKLDGKLDTLATASARVETTLADHEKRLTGLRGDVDPLKSKVSEARGVAWLVGIVVTLVGLAATVKGLAG
jgi:hypothetical protein